MAYTTAFIGSIGFSSLVHRRSLLTITFVRDKFPEILGRVFDILIWIGIILYFRLFITYGLVFAQSAVGRFSPSQVFELSQVRMIIPVGGALIVLQAIKNIIQDVNRWVASRATTGKDTQ